MKYTTPLQRSFSIYVNNEKRYVGGLYTSLFCVIIPALFPYFLPFWYPYILLHFQMFLFLITCLCLFLAAAHAICHHRRVGVLTGSRSPCFARSQTPLGKGLVWQCGVRAGYILAPIRLQKLYTSRSIADDVILYAIYIR